MGYCTVSDFEKTLAQTVTTGSPNPGTLDRPGKLSDLGKKLNLTRTTPDGSSVGTYSLSDVYFYIRQAMSIVDAALSQQYVVPISPKCVYESTLADSYFDSDSRPYITIAGQAHIFTGGDQVVAVNPNEYFSELRLEVDDSVDAVNGSTIRLMDSDEVADIEDWVVGSRILIVRYPDPIPYVTAKLACASFYDKWAKAQSEPMKSEYGTILRQEGLAELNNIREGRTILHGAERIGSRFVNPNLYDRYALKGVMDQDGTRSDQTRN